MPCQNTRSLARAIHFSIPKCPIWIFWSTSPRSELGTTIRVPFRTSPLTNVTSSRMGQGWMTDLIFSFEGHPAFVHPMDTCSDGSLAVASLYVLSLSSEIGQFFYYCMYKGFYVSFRYFWVCVFNVCAIQCLQKPRHALVCTLVRSRMVVGLA